MLRALRSPLVLASHVAAGDCRQWRRAAARPSASSRRVQRELKTVADERRKIEGQRGDASAPAARGRRAGRPVQPRAARDRGARWRASRPRWRQLQQQRDALQRPDSARSARNWRAAARGLPAGRHAPLKLLLAQDRVADGSRMLAYHRYLQRDRAARIADADRRAERDSTRSSARSRSDAGRARRHAASSSAAQLGAAASATASERAAAGRQARPALPATAARAKSARPRCQGARALLEKLRAAAPRRGANAAPPPSAPPREQARRAAAKAPRANRVVGRQRAGRRRSAASAGRCRARCWPASAAHARRPQQRRPADRAPAPAPRSRRSPTAAWCSAEWMTGYGLMLIVDHGNGYMSLYAHNDALLKDVGDTRQARRRGGQRRQFRRPGPAGAVLRTAPQRRSRSTREPGCRR